MVCPISFSIATIDFWSSGVTIEIAVPADVADRAVEAISSAAKTGQIGDGKIFVYSIDQAVRIRTGETDADAL